MNAVNIKKVLTLLRTQGKYRNENTMKVLELKEHLVNLWLDSI
jgi:hypothetical protein